MARLSFANFNQRPSEFANCVLSYLGESCLSVLHEKAENLR